MNERTSFDLNAAFDPTLRAAQADLDAYLLTRPTEDSPGQINTPEYSPVDGSQVSYPAIARDGLADITKSFESPVIRPRAQSKPDRIGMILDDIRDNGDWARPPYAAKHDGLEAGKLVERLLPQEGIEAIRRLGQHYEEGHMYRRIAHVGDKKDGTFHPHFYFMDRTRVGVTRMYFVDAEHLVAIKNFIRPSIANLVGIEVPDQPGETPKVAIIRCRIPKYDYEHKPEGLREELRTVIEQVLDNGGDLPDRLSGDAERQVLFMIAASGDSSRVQGRYSTKKQIDAFAKGETGSKALEGKVWVQAYVVNKLIKLFNQRAEAREVA